MAATTDQQISLTIAPRGSSSHLNRPARQLVPAFLQKLYEMVNDPANQDLIRWSDTGDSFFVLDQERFASEVLGRWFKHNRFSSFVRQLNMYGFHKIPHLQQGVLRSDSDTEFWNFEHPHFLRGQPDLLCLIQRKKQVATMGDDTHVAPTIGKDTAGSAAVATLSANQLVDINSIVNGIQAIKRHQAAISADLNVLKSSNQHLWQEAMAARERHKKHQDTINRIVKFLAGVFGHGDNQMRKDEDAQHAVVARKPQRLLIADGRSERGAETNKTTEDGPRSSMESARSTNSTDFLSSLNTPPAQPSELFTTPRFTSVEPSVIDAPTPVATEPPPVPRETQSATIVPPPNAPPAALTTATGPPPSQMSNDSIVQAALTSVLNSPTQMQKLLAVLASQSISPEVFPPAPQPHHQQHLIAPTPYNNNHQQYHPNENPGSGNVVNAAPQLPPTFDYTAANALSPFTLSLLGAPSDPDPFALQQEEERLQKTYRTTTEINNDVDELHNNIHSLIQSLGIDPSALESETATGVGSGGGTSAPPSMGDVDMFPPVNMGPGQDFDFDSFLMDMPRPNEEDGDLDKLAERLDPSAVSDPSKIGNASSEQLHAFLDEVASQDGSEGVGAGHVGAGMHQLHSSQAFKAPTVATNGAISGMGGTNVGAGPGLGTRGRKRKSDVIADNTSAYGVQEARVATQPTAPSVPSSLAGSRSKRKR